MALRGASAEQDVQSQAMNQAVGDPAASASRPASEFRLRGALVAVPCLAVLWIAHGLTPRRAGFGTHENLGLPPCSFLAKTGYPCPSCGLTTATSAVVHGQFRAAWFAHPMGFVIVAGLAAAGLLGLGELLTGRDFLRWLRPGAWWAVVALVSLLGGWGFKVAHGLATGALPIR